jgi:hypothetical protein
VAPDTVDHADAERLFEIGLEGDVCDVVRRADPTARVAAARPSTILWSRRHDPDELQVLLGALSDFGLTPCEVHQSSAGIPAVQGSAVGPADAANTRPRYCEVRVRCRLGAAALHHLGWSHRVVAMTVVTIGAPRSSLRGILAQMWTVADVAYVVALRARPAASR